MAAIDDAILQLAAVRAALKSPPVKIPETDPVLVAKRLRWNLKQPQLIPADVYKAAYEACTALLSTLPADTLTPTISKDETQQDLTNRLAAKSSFDAKLSDNYAVAVAAVAADPVQDAPAAGDASVKVP